MSIPVRKSIDISLSKEDIKLFKRLIKGYEGITYQLIFNRKTKMYFGALLYDKVTTLIGFVKRTTSLSVTVKYSEL